MKRSIIIGTGIVVVIVFALVAFDFMRQGKVELSSKSISILQEPSDNVILLTDIRYQKTNRNNCYLDIAYQDDGKAKPLLLLVHGGSWTSGSREEMNLLLYTFSARGYTVASIDYDLLNLIEALQGNCFSITDEEACVAAAVNYLTAHAEEYQIDIDRVVLIGHSSGGQLVGHLAEQIVNQPEDYAFQLSGLILLAAPSDLRYYLYNNMHMEGLDFSFVELSFIFDGVYGTDVISEINKVDIFYNITEKLPPVLIIQGSDDTLVPVSMSQNLFDSFEAAGVTAELTVIPGAGHSLLDHETTFFEIDRFLNQYILDSKKE